jgi:N-acetylneuraminic acid mutarotase
MRLTPLPLLLVLLAGCRFGGVNDRDLRNLPGWHALAPLPFARQETGVAALDGRVYVVGGLILAGPVSTVERYLPELDAWERVAPLPEELHHPNVAAVGNLLYVLGGFNNDGVVGRVYAYDPTTDTWSRRATMPAGTERGAAGVAVVGSRLYVLGGLRGTSVADASVYDTERDTWTALPALPSPRDHLVAGAVNGRVFAIGGRSNRLFSDVDELEPVTGSWLPRTPMPTARAGSGGAVLNNRIYVFGGEGNRADPLGIFPQSEVYDPETDTWRELDPMPTPRHGFGGAVILGRIYLPGGATRQGLGAVDAHESYVP